MHVVLAQAAVRLSRPGDDISGGELGLTEQYPAHAARALRPPLRGWAGWFAGQRCERHTAQDRQAQQRQPPG